MLKVAAEANSKRCRRPCDGKPLNSTQRAERGRLLGRFGAYTFSFQPFDTATLELSYPVVAALSRLLSYAPSQAR